MLTQLLRRGPGGAVKYNREVRESTLNFGSARPRFEWPTLARLPWASEPQFPHARDEDVASDIACSSEDSGGGHVGSCMRNAQHSVRHGENSKMREP